MSKSSRRRAQAAANSPATPGANSVANSVANSAANSADRPSGKSTARRVVNLRLLAGTLVILAITGAVAYGIHAFQVSRNAKAVLATAEEFAENGDYVAAAGHLFRYVQLRPDDPAGRLRLAEVYDRAAQGRRQNARTIELYYEALGVAPAGQQAAIHGRLAELLNDAGRFPSAEEEARKLLEVAASESDAAQWQAKGTLQLARALYGEHARQTLREKPAAVGEAFEEARKLNPEAVQLATTLAHIYRQQRELLPEAKQNLPAGQREAMADRILDELVAANPALAEAYLARYQYRMLYKLPKAEEDLAAALKLGPEKLDVLLQAAAAARRDAALTRPASEESRQAARKAAGYYQRAIEVAPTDHRAYLGLGELELAGGDAPRAMNTWREGLEKAPGGTWTLNARLTDALLASGKLEEAAKPLAALGNLLEREVKLNPAVQPAEEAALEREHDLLRARWLGRTGKRSEAMAVARRVGSGPKTTAQEVADALQAALLLGEWYGSLNQWEQAAKTFEEAAKLQPKSAQLLAVAAGAWSAANRPDLAAKCFDQAVALHGAPGLQVARAWAHFRREAVQPKGARNWEAFAKVLAEAKQAQTAAIQEPTEPLPASQAANQAAAQLAAQAEAWRLGLLEAEYVLVRAEEDGKIEEGRQEAMKLLKAVEQQAEKLKHPRGLLSALALAYERLEQPAEADRVVAALEKQEDAAGEVCLLRARLATNRKQHEVARQTLESGIAKLPAAAHARLRRELVQASLREGQLERAGKEFLALEDVGAADIELLCQLAETALDSGKPAEAEVWEGRLRKVEGDDGLFWRYYQARRLLAQVEKADDPRVRQAAELVAGIQAQHPGWGPIHLLQALLLEVQGKRDDALGAYKEAIRLGEQRLAVYERLIGLLTQMGRLAEAERYLAILQDQVIGSQRLTAMELSLSAGRGQMEQALDLARRRAEKHPKDATSQVWLGQMLVANGKLPEAEAPILRAAELAPGNAAVQGALFGYYVRVKQPEKARQVLAKLAAIPHLKDPEKSLTLAHGYELLKDEAQAMAAYRQAAQAAAADAAVQMRLVEFLLRTGKSEDTAEAEKLLRDGIKRWAKPEAARRMLAGLLVDRGGEAEWQEAQDLLAKAGSDAGNGTGNGAGSGDSVLDRRLQAIFLLRRGGKVHRAQARLLLKALVADAKLATANDRLLLAGLEEEDGQVDAARGQYAVLAADEKCRPEHLAAYIGFLLRQGPPAEADKQLQRLEKLAPDHRTTVALRARWHQTQNQAAKIVELVEPWAEKLLKKVNPAEPDQEIQVCETVGDLYAAVEQYAAAERWYRRLHKAAPARFEPLALTLARQNRLKEAVDLCAEAAKVDLSVKPAAVLAGVLVAGQPSAEDLQRAESIVVAAGEKNKDNPESLFTLATLRLAQGRYDDAAAVYREVVKTNPGNPVALNNLATVLAERAETRKEALTLVDQAIKTVGPQTWLQDTKGTILLLEQRAAEAVPLLEEATSGHKPDPRFYLHLAAACERAGDTAKARAAWKNAEKGDLKREILTPADRKLVEQLDKKYRT